LEYDDNATINEGRGETEGSKKRSRKRFPWMGGFQDMAEITIQIADALEIPRFGLMGMSCGCTYALAVAYKYPHRLLSTPIQLFSPWIPPAELSPLSMVRMASKLKWVLTPRLIMKGLSLSDRAVRDPKAILGWEGKMMRFLGKLVRVSGKLKETWRKWLGWVCLMVMFSKKNGNTGLATPQNTVGVGADGGQGGEGTTQRQRSHSAAQRTLYWAVIQNIVYKLEAVSYTMIHHPDMSPHEAEQAAVGMFVPALNMEAEDSEIVDDLSTGLMPTPPMSPSSTCPPGGIVDASIQKSAAIDPIDPIRVAVTPGSDLKNHLFVKVNAAALPGRSATSSRSPIPSESDFTFSPAASTTSLLSSHSTLNQTPSPNSYGSRDAHSPILAYRRPSAASVTFIGGSKPITNEKAEMMEPKVADASSPIRRSTADTLQQCTDIMPTNNNPSTSPKAPKAPFANLSIKTSIFTKDKSKTKQTSFPTDSRPAWIHANIDPELPLLEQFRPRPYLNDSEIHDVLHSLERTGPIGFDYKDIDTHRVCARHGTLDSLIPVKDVERMAMRCGWRLVRYQGGGHALFSNVIVMRSAMEDIANGLVHRGSLG
jgi:pimeloyl-ACP methyl ester carboxylesterase